MAAADQPDHRDEIARHLRALHDDASRRRDDANAELTRIAQAASLLGVSIDQPASTQHRPWYTSHLAEHLATGGVVPRGRLMLTPDPPEVVLPLTAKHGDWLHIATLSDTATQNPTQDDSVEGDDHEGSAGEADVLATEPNVDQQAGRDAAIAQAAGPPLELSSATDGTGGVAPPAPPPDRARAVAARAGEILDSLDDGHTIDVGPVTVVEPPTGEHRCDWCDFTSPRSQAVGSHESRKHPAERARKLAAEREAIAAQRDPLAQVAEDLATYKGNVLACQQRDCGWMVPVQKTGALDRLAIHTLSEHGRGPSRRERTPQERP